MFFLPLFDDNPTKGTPKITYSLILINILVFIYQLTLNPDQEYRLFLDYGFIPKEFFESTYIGYFELISSLFLHGGFMHLFSPMLFLYIFGDNIECILGPIKFTIFYLICGFIASIFQGIIDPSSTVPMIGASGSIAGVLGAYFLIYPRANVRVFAWIFIFVQIINVPAGIVLGFWIIGQFFSLGSNDGVAYLAHIAGFIAGLMIMVFTRNKSNLSTQEQRTKPFSSTSFNDAYKHKIYDQRKSSGIKKYD